MTTDTKLAPTDAEIFVVAREAGLLPDNSHPTPETRVGRKHSNAVQAFARAVLARWGQPAHSGEPVAWLDPWRADQVTTDYDAYGKHGIPLYTAPRQEAHHLTQALTDPENQPNQYGVEFGMSGPQMHFKIGNQLFRLAYEPDEQEEFDYMKRMLLNAFTTFTHDVKTAPQPSPAAQGDALSDAVRVPLDSLHADAAYLIGRLREGSMPYARVIEIIRERIDAAKAALRARAAQEARAMTTDTKLAPTDAEIDALIVYFGPTSGLRKDSRDLMIKKLRELVRTAIAKWGQTAPRGEPVYAFRRKGLDNFCTCTKKRYAELSAKPNLFETCIFYTAPQPLPTSPTQAQAVAPESAEFEQFLSDVLTAAGLVTHGKQCKALGERLADMCVKLRLHGIK